LNERNGRQNNTYLQWYPYAPDTTNKKDTLVYMGRMFDIDSTVNSDQLGGYLHYVLEQGRVRIVAGVRADYFRLVRDYAASPRLGFIVKAHPLGVFTLSGGLYYQLPADLSGNLKNLMTPDPNYPFAVHPRFDELELQRNWQVVLGYERELPASNSLNIEAYFKWYDREYTLSDPDTYQYARLFTQALTNNTPFVFPEPAGEKMASGIELSLGRKQQERFFYALCYSLLTIRNNYADGKWHNDKNNVRNSLALTLGANLFKSHSVSLRICATEGRPYCKVKTDLTGVLLYDEAAGYFTERLQPTCTVNFRYNLHLFRKWGNLIVYFELWNLLNYSPVLERQKGYLNYVDVQAGGIVPMAGITADF
jgi:hypothetical protein